MDFTKLIIIGIIIAFSVGFLASVSFSWDVNTNQYLSVIQSFISVVAFVIPFQKLSAIIYTTIALVVFKYSIAIIKTIWQILPIG